MGNLFQACSSARNTDTTPLHQEQEAVQPAATIELGVIESQSQNDSAPVMRAMIAPIGGRGGLTGAQEAARRRFGM